MMVVLIKKVKYLFNILKKDLINSYHDIVNIPSLSDLCIKYKRYNPIIKSFIPFVYIKLPILQLLIILSASCFFYVSILHFSSESEVLALTLLEISLASIYLTLVKLFLAKHVKLSHSHDKILELLAIIIIFLFLCFSIIYFGTRTIILVIIPVLLIKYYFKYYSNNSFDLVSRLKDNVVAKTLSARTKRIDNLFSRTMFVSGFYNQFVSRQYWLIVAYYLTHETSYECFLLVQYGIFHICLNITNRSIAALFGNPRGIVVSKTVDTMASIIGITVAIGGAATGFVTF
jgi:hypothetical protein